jgi:type IV fimbrial biogenesis protein FimT
MINLFAAKRPGILTGMRLRPRANGFSLIELMVTIAVAAVLVAWSVPSLNNLLLGNRLTARTNDLVGSIQYARSEAVKRGRPVNVTSKTAAANCTANCDWKDGWRVWFDTDNDGAYDAGEELRDIPATSGFKNLVFETSLPSIAFLPNGSLNQTNGIGFAMNTSDMNAGSKYRAVCIAFAGVVTSKSGTSAPSCP